MKTNYQTSNSIKHSSLFKLYDIEYNYQTHKKKINHIKNRNARDKIRKQYLTQVNAANDLKSNWLLSQTGKLLEKQREIYEQNKILYNQIIKVRNRSSSHQKPMSQTHLMNRSSRFRTSSSVNRENDQKTIMRQNQKLMQKILTVKSPLSKENMNASYKKIRQNQRRIETYSSENRSRIKQTLTKFNLKPKIYFPQIVKNSDKEEKDMMRNKQSFTKLTKLENEFLSLDMVSKKTEHESPWKKRSILAKSNSPHNKQFLNSPKNKKFFSKTKFEFPLKVHLNTTNF